MRPLPTSRANASIAEYEELRARVLAGPTSGRTGSHLDMRLLIREGVAAWMTRCSTHTVMHVPLVEPAQRPTDAKLVTDDLKAGLVRGLASMALAMRRELST